MKIDFSKQITDFDGKAVPTDGDADAGALTLKTVALNALLTLIPGENVEGEEKAKRYALALRIHGATEPLDLTAEEVAKIKQLAGRIYFPLVVGRSYELLN